jgi:type I restriction enzyme, R subunit
MTNHIMVVDKLLTGFDEPRNAVLYIDKPVPATYVVRAGFSPQAAHW